MHFTFPNSATIKENTLHASYLKNIYNIPQHPTRNISFPIKSLENFDSISFSKKSFSPMIRSGENINNNLQNNNDNTVSTIPSSSKKMLWGEPTWLFLHTIAHKVKDESFYLIKVELLNIIYSICSNLPCPMCASHAREHLNSINFNSIQTKEQLKLMLFHFHNLVNIKKNLPQFLLEDLDDKYSKANFKNIINYFIKYYTNTTGIIKMISEDFYRKRLTNNTIMWLNTNFIYFNY